MGIVVDKELESEVADMCNYSDYIERSAIEQNQKDNVIRMSEIGFRVDQIAASLGLTVEKVEQILQSVAATV